MHKNMFINDYCLTCVVSLVLNQKPVVRLIKLPVKRSVNFPVLVKMENKRVKFPYILQ